jgi:alginate O-acetyltransferase complex protein AlgJ
MPAILHFARELEARGLELVFVPIPVRPAIYPEGVLEMAPGAEPGDLMPAQTELLGRLRAEGVTAIDLTPRFLANRHHERGPLFVPSDTHWTPVAAVLAARAVAEELTDRPWYEAVPRLQLHRRWTAHEHFGGHFRQLRDRAGVTDLVANPISLRKIKVRSPDGAIRLELRNPDAPVVVIGDSNTIWWRQLSAAFPHQLAAELGFAVDVLSTTGGGANETRLNLRRTLEAEPGYLEGKRAVIWCFSARSFTNTREGWLEIGL